MSLKHTSTTLSSKKWLPGATPIFRPLTTQTRSLNKQGSCRDSQLTVLETLSESHIDITICFSSSVECQWTVATKARWPLQNLWMTRELKYCRRSRTRNRRTVSIRYRRCAHWKGDVTV